jgi:hypothetical protein
MKSLFSLVVLASVVSGCGSRAPSVGTVQWTCATPLGAVIVDVPSVEGSPVRVSGMTVQVKVQEVLVPVRCAEVVVPRQPESPPTVTVVPSMPASVAPSAPDAAPSVPDAAPSAPSAPDAAPSAPATVETPSVAPSAPASNP